MPTETPTQRLASLLLREPVLPWIQQRRAAGKTWRAIADDLRVMTKGEIDVPHQTLAYWAEREPAEQAEPVEQAS